MERQTRDAQRSEIRKLRDARDVEGLIKSLYREPIKSVGELRLRAVQAAIRVCRQRHDLAGLVALLHEQAVLDDKWLRRDASHAAVAAFKEQGDVAALVSLLSEPAIEAVDRVSGLEALMARTNRDGLHLVMACDGDCVRTLCDLLERDPDPLVRFNAAKCLVERGDPAAGPCLTHALEDESSKVVGPAIIGAGKLRLRDAVPSLVSLLEREGFFGSRLAADSLVEIRDGKAIPLLERLVSGTKSRSTRRLAERTVRRLREATGAS
jgi:HEAT repeat protein